MVLWRWSCGTCQWGWCGIFKEVDVVLWREWCYVSRYRLWTSLFTSIISKYCRWIGLTTITRHWLYTYVFFHSAKSKRNNVNERTLKSQDINSSSECWIMIEVCLQYMHIRTGHICILYLFYFGQIFGGWRFKKCWRICAWRFLKYSVGGTHYGGGDTPPLYSFMYF